MQQIFHMIVRGFSLGSGAKPHRAAFAPAFVPLFVLSGCVEIIPADPEAEKVFGSVEKIRIGETTRAEVLELLGEPKSVGESDVSYFGQQRTASFFIWHPYTVHVPYLTEPWRVRISFDPDGVVDAVYTSEEGDR